MTINELYSDFSHAKEWRRLAKVMYMRAKSIILTPHGETEADTLTRGMLNQWLTESGRPDSDTVPVRSVLTHAMTWAGLWKKETATKPRQKAENRQPKPTEEKPTAKPAPKEPTKRKAPAPRKTATRTAKPKPTPKPAVAVETANRRRKGNGTVYHDGGSKGYDICGNRVFKNRWRAEINIDGQRYRHRGPYREECVEWLKAVKAGKIKPTDNKADWWRMEQRKDEQVRIDEIIVSQAEEAVMLYDYHQSGDLSKINEYLTKRLLPHMVYYATHTLKLGRESIIKAARQAAGLLLTRITANRPVLNFTASCKRMLRVYKQRGDFFYYENAPEQVQLLVNGIDFGPLAEVWRVTKDRRL